MSAPPVFSTAGHSQLENDVLLDSTVSIEAKATLTLLRYFDRGNGRGCFAHKETLCRFLKISPYRLRRALLELQDLGRITIQRRGQGHPDLIFVVPREELQEREPIQVDVEGELQEELPEITPADLPEPLENSDDSEDSEVNDVEIQTDEILSVEHYKEENKINNNTLNQCDELISYFFLKKEDREPTKNELINWTPTATRLLNEFSFDELKPAVENAIAQGARLFYFVALTAPAFILKSRQQREADIHRERKTERGKEGEEGRNRRLEETKASATVYATETTDLIEALSPHVRPQILRSFFGDVFISAIDAGSITLTAPSEIIAQWIEERYSGLLREVAGREVRIVSA